MFNTVSDTHYKVVVGCWNCDTTQELWVNLGTNVIDHIEKTKPVCILCQCTTLQFYKNYQMETNMIKMALGKDPKQHDHIC